MHYCSIVRSFFKLVCGRFCRLRCLDLGAEKVLVDIQKFRFCVNRLVTNIREISVVLRSISVIEEGKLQIPPHIFWNHKFQIFHLFFEKTRGLSVFLW